MADNNSPWGRKPTGGGPAGGGFGGGAGNNGGSGKNGPNPFEKILKDKRLSDKLRGELGQLATAATQPEGHA